MAFISGWNKDLEFISKYQAKGTAIPGDTISDPDNIFTKASGLNLTSKSYAPLKPFRAIKIKGGAAGQSGVKLEVYYMDGSSEVETFNVDANGVVILEGIYAGIQTGSNTTAINVFPVF